MDLKFQPRFNDEQLKTILRDRFSKIEQAAISRLQLVGEKFVTNARNDGAYKDHTGNLRSSVGYVILKDGIQIAQNFKAFPQVDPKAKGAGQGVEKAQAAIDEIAAKLAAQYPRSLILICVAGMDYAAAVESKGFDVITANSIKAKADLETGFKELQDKIPLVK